MSGSGYPKGGYVRSTERAVKRDEERERRMIEHALRRDEPIGKTRAPDLNSDEVEQVISDFSFMNERATSLVRRTKERVPIVVQKCRACRAEIETRVLQRWALDANWRVTLINQIRHDYDSHLCKPVETALNGRTHEEMDQLLFDTENELERVAKRAEAIRARMLTHTMTPADEKE